MSRSLRFGLGLLPFPLFWLLFTLPGNSYGQMSQSKYGQLIYLNFPQSEQAIVSRFGTPINGNGQDYAFYPAPRRDYYVRINYVGNRAQSFNVVLRK